MICHCDACNYTFDTLSLHSKEELPTRCPDCGKKTVGHRSPAVRAATEAEIAEYWEDQRHVLEEMSALLNTENGEVETLPPATKQYTRN